MSARSVLTGGTFEFGVDLGEDQFAAVGVVIEQFAVAAPVDGDVELLLSVFGGEAAAEQVAEEVVAQRAVVAVLQRLADGPHQRRVLYGEVREQLGAGQDIGGVPVPAGVGQERLRALDLE